MAKLVGGWEQDSGSIRVFAVIPPRRNGEANAGALAAALVALSKINPEAFDPVEIAAPTQAHNDGHTADGGGIIPESVAKVMIRDLERDDDEGAPVDPYAGAACNIGGRCDD